MNGLGFNLEDLCIVSPEEDTYETFGKQIQYIEDHILGYFVVEICHAINGP